MTSRRRVAADARIYALLLRATRDLEPYRRDALETYLDLRREAAERGGVRGVAEHFLHAAGRAAAAAVAELWERTRRPRPRLVRYPRRSPRSLDMLSTLHHDLRFALRGLRQRPAFSLAVIVMLALGIGATTTVFSVVDGVLLRGLPYPDAERLVYFENGSHPKPILDEWRQVLGSFDEIAAVWKDRHHDLTGDGPPAQLTTADVTPDFLPLFGATAVHGRLLDASDRADDRVAVVDAGLWRRRWGGDPSLVGRTIRLDGEPWTIVGVISPDFVKPERLVGRQVDLWKPLDTDHEWMQVWNMHILSVVGRLRPGAELEAAQAEVDELGTALAEVHPERRLREGGPRTTPLVPLHEATVGSIGRALYVLLGAVGLMLLIGCANVANLLLARGTDRRRELALRSALGAGRRRLVSQLLVESLVLSLAGGLLGVMLARLGVRGFELVRPENLPRAAEITVDWRVLAFTLAVSLVTGVLFGLVPALQTVRRDMNQDLKETPGAGGGRQRLRGALVVAEVAMALVLLTGAGLLGHSLFRILQVEPGFEAEGLVRLKLLLGEDLGDESRLPFTRELLERLEPLPAVTSVSAGWTVPFDITGGSRCCWRTTFRAELDDEPTRSIVHPVTPGYFYTLGAASLRGREFSWADGEAEPVAAVLNRSMARKLFGDDEPVGRRFFRGTEETTEMQVVGVVDGVRRWGLDNDGEDAVYVPYTAYGSDLGELSVVLRTAAPLTPALAQSIRERVWEIDPTLPVAELASLPSMISRSLSEPRFFSILFGVFAGLAILLAASGITSSLLYSVGQRHHELGIRLAVGARDVDLLRLVIRQGMILTSAGLVLGLIGAGFLARFLSSLIFELSATDPPTFAGVAVVLALVALGACMVPAVKASRTDPARTLRAD